ncbi:MAG: hypothetical protein M3N98_06320 [Actinomycetota bacterium]|nr:hypothetical protein [Actinomycetota bacterium]
MSDSQKSFFSGLSGTIAGVATLVSAIVAMIGLSVNQGWIGGHHSQNAGSPAATSTSTSASSPGASTTSTSSATGGTSGVTTSMVGPQLALDPTALAIDGAVGPKDTTVKVSNPGSVTITVTPPTITGVDAARFAVNAQDCAAPLDPGRSCQLKVTFTPPGPGTFNATLVVQADVVPRAQEVPIRATAIL